MYVGLSSASFYPQVLTENSIALMKKLGFQTGELFLNSISEYDEDFTYKLIEEKEKRGFQINSVHAFSSSFEPYIFDSYKRRRDDMMKYFKMVCKSCRDLGASSYTFHGMRKVDFKNQDKKFILDVYSELAYIANEFNIKLAQENVSWCMSSDIKYLSMLKNEVKYPIYFTLDIKQAHRAGIDHLEYLNVMKDRLVNIHINDKNGECDCLLPGEGEIKYEDLFHILSHLKYKGNLIIEVYRSNYSEYEEIIKSKKFLDKIISKK